MMSLKVLARSAVSLMLLLALVCGVNAQTVIWEAQTYTNGSPLNGSHAIAVDAHQNAYVTGTVYTGVIGGHHSSDIGTIMYNAKGQRVWMQTYDGVGHDIDQGTAIAVDTKGNVYVAGTTWTGTAAQKGTEYDWIVLKYSSAGSLQWAKRLNGPQSANDYAVALKLDSQDNVIVTGTVTQNVHYHIATAKWDTNGKLLWTQIIKGFQRGDDQSTGLVIDSKDNVIVAGNVYLGDPAKGGSGYKWVVQKYSPTGTPIWYYYYGGRAKANNGANAIAIDSQDNIIVAGYQADSIDRNNIVHTSYSTVKFLPNGKPMWGASYVVPGRYNCSINAIAVDGRGFIYVTGSQGPDQINPSVTATDAVTVKYGPRGQFVWDRVYHPDWAYDTAGRGIAVTAAGYVYLGVSNVYALNKSCVEVQSYSPYGVPRWDSIQHNPPAHDGDIALFGGIALDIRGNAYVTEVFGDYVTSNKRSYFDTFRYAP